MMLFRTASATHVGTVRSVNQDAVYESNDLCAVADGMGGKSGGRKAADQVLLTAKQIFDRMANGNVKPKRILITDDPDPNRVTVDYVHNLLIVSGGPKIRIYRREAEGKEKPLRVIQIPKEYYPKGIDDGASGGEGGQQNQTALMTINSQRGLVFVNTRIGGRFALEDFVGVWSVFDDGEVYPLYTIGGPNNLLKDVRGIALDPKEKMVIVSDKTHNAIFNFHVPEVF